MWPRWFSSSLKVSYGRKRRKVYFSIFFWGGGGGLRQPVCKIAASLHWTIYLLIWSIDGMRSGRRKPKYSERNMSQCHFTHQKFHIDHAGLYMRLCGEKLESVTCLPLQRTSRKWEKLTSTSPAYISFLVVRYYEQATRRCQGWIGWAWGRLQYAVFRKHQSTYL
jgi:hypothetical protein